MVAVTPGEVSCERGEAAPPHSSWCFCNALSESANKIGAEEGVQNRIESGVGESHGNKKLLNSNAWRNGYLNP